jgi:ABC-type transporter Mla subunit MlaD
MATEAEIEILVRVVDQFTSSVDAMGKKLEDFERRLARAEASAASASSRAAEGMKAAGNEASSFGSKFQSAFSAAEGAMGAVDKVLTTVKANLQEFSLMAALVGTALERAFSAPAMDLIQTGLAYDDLKTKTIGTYETMFRGMENVGQEAEKLYDRIQRLADYTPFSSGPLITGSQLFGWC